MGFWQNQLAKNAGTKSDEELRKQAADKGRTYDDRKAAREELKKRQK